MADTLHLDALENRLQSLENVVFGPANKDAVYPKDGKQEECIESLSNIENKLSTAVTGKRKLTQLYQRLSELQKYLDPAYADEVTLSNSARVDVILAEEDFLRQQVARLETMQKLQDTLDSEHIRAVPSHSSKLQDLSQIQIKQQDQTSEVTEEIRNLFGAYNSIITLLSKQLIQWDETVTKLEITSQPKKQSN